MKRMESKPRNLKFAKAESYLDRLKTETNHLKNIIKNRKVNQK